MLIILLGAPGCGKGTLSSILQNDFSFKHLSTGELFRSEVSKKTPLGKKITSIMKSGKLVDDDTTNQLVSKYLKNAKGNLILDGYPRTLNQAKFLDTIQNVDKVIYFKVSKKVLEKRITGRCSCPKCGALFNVNIKGSLPNKDSSGTLRCTKCNSILTTRPDDNKNTFNTRYDGYLKSTFLIYPYYKKQGKIIKFNAKHVGTKYDVAVKKLTKKLLKK